MESHTRRLPLIAALAAFALYVCTMGASATFNSLPLVMKLSGLTDTPIIGQPLLWLFTLPMHLLPAAWVPVALKLFSAITAAAIIGLLTRTIQLLPWDHSWDTASRFAAALPLVTAACLCGLEFSFWQEATSTPGELLDLLVLATAVWLLLEYKARKNSRWLDAATVVWGAGMAENWVMLVTLPLFIGGIIWLMRLRFFRWVFILRMLGLGLAGFSLYLVMPMVNGLAPHSPWTLGEAWLTSLRQTRNVALMFYYQYWRGHRLLTMAVMIYFLVPTLPLLVRMRDEGTSNRAGADIFQMWIYRTLRVALLAACLWLVLDPVMGARQMAHSQLGAWMALLTLDYVTAVGAAFLVGNLVLISQPVAARDGMYRPRSTFPWKKFLVPLGTVVIALTAIGLVARNAPAIVHMNFHPVEKFGVTAVNSLPPGRGVVLGDFPVELDVFRVALGRNARRADWLAVDTKALPTVAYRARLEHLRPGGWLTESNRHELTQLETLRLLEHVARSNQLFYLHPSYGYFFERFYLTPTGTVYEMKLRGKDPLDVPPVPAATIERNEQLWTGLWNQDLASVVSPAGPPGFWEKRFRIYGIVRAPRYQDRVLAEWYSMHLDAWGVTLQKLGRYREAQVRLAEALQLSTNNLSARLSLACNTNLQAGNPMGLADLSRVAGQLESLDKLNLIMNVSGPFDEPTVSYLLGSSFLDHGLWVQAAEQIERVRVMVPGAIICEMALVEVYNRLQMTERSRPLLTHLREETKKLPANSSLDLNLALLDSYSWLLQTNSGNARDVLRSVVEQHPDDPEVKRRVLAAYLAFGDVTNALGMAEAQLEKTPDDVSSLNNKAVILIQMGRALEAIPLLGRVLTITNQPAARMNRALAYLAKDNYEQAAGDLHELQTVSASAPMVNFGLAMVAQHAHDTNEAIRYFQLTITNSPAGSALWQQAVLRLRAIQPAPPEK